MNTLVNFETAKLLKEKGFDGKIEQGYYLPHPDIAEINNVERDVWILLPYNPLLNQVIAPTIAEVVCWIYSKYDIWVSLIPDSSSGHRLLDRKFSVSMFRFNMNLNVQAEILRKDKNILYFNLPENAFEYAIAYILNTYKPIG